MIIGDKMLGPGQPTYIIAEAGIAHAGSVEAAHKFVKQAAKRGADAIKFQAFHPEEPLFCPWPGDEHRWCRWKESSLTLSEWGRVKATADNNGIDLILSAFQPIVISWIKALDLPAYKVASRAVMRFPFADAPGPFIISTGAMKPEHWRTVQDRVGTKGRTFLQCCMDYPHDPRPWSTVYGGLSDHSGTIWPSMGAILHQAGADIVEVHVAFAKQNANDAAVSITQEDLKLLCEARDVSALMRAA